MKTPAKILQEARALIENPDHWCQGHLSKHTNGKMQRCALGALQDSSYFNGTMKGLLTARSFLYDAVQILSPGDGISLLNDTTNHETVLKMFDLAIDHAKQGEK